MYYTGSFIGGHLAGVKRSGIGYQLGLAGWQGSGPVWRLLWPQVPWACRRAQRPACIMVVEGEEGREGAGWGWRRRGRRWGSVGRRSFRRSPEGSRVRQSRRCGPRIPEPHSSLPCGWHGQDCGGGGGVQGVWTRTRRGRRGGRRDWMRGGSLGGLGTCVPSPWR